MIRYQVRFEFPESWVINYSESVIANSEQAAIVKVKKKYPTSYGHWVNSQANEAV